MVEPNTEPLNTTNNNFIGDTEEVEKLLSVVVKRRKTIPAKCMELSKQTTTFELLRLENAKVLIEESKDTENFKRIYQELKKIRLEFSLEDLKMAEERIQKYHRRNKEIRNYLEKRNKYLKT